MKKGIRFFSYLIFCFVLLLPLAAAPEGDILLQLRFYQGIRGPKPAVSSQRRKVRAFGMALCGSRSAPAPLGVLYFRASRGTSDHALLECEGGEDGATR